MVSEPRRLDLRRLLGASLRFFKPQRGSRHRRERELGRPPVEGRQPGLVKAVERMPPALAAGSAARTTRRSSEKWVKTWRTVPIALRPGAELRRSTRSRQARPCRRAALSPAGGPARPRHRVRSSRRRHIAAAATRFGLDARGRLRARRWRRPRSLQPSGHSLHSGALRPADRRAEVHHRLGEIAGPARPASSSSDEFVRSSRGTVVRARGAARSRARHWCRPQPPVRRTRSRRSRPTV